jgi:hypothetical protein
VLHFVSLQKPKGFCNELLRFASFSKFVIQTKYFLSQNFLCQTSLFRFAFKFSKPRLNILFVWNYFSNYFMCMSRNININKNMNMLMNLNMNKKHVFEEVQSTWTCSVMFMYINMYMLMYIHEQELECVQSMWICVSLCMFMFIYSHIDMYRYIYMNIIIYMHEYEHKMYKVFNISCTSTLTYLTVFLPSEVI